MIKEVLANIYFIKESENGHKYDITNTKLPFRPLFCYKSNNYHCQIDFGSNKIIRLGNNYKLKIRLIDICPIEIGSKFELKETRLIATGEILAFL